MSKARKMGVLVATGIMLLTSMLPAFAEVCVIGDRGNPHADSGSWTKLNVSQQANNTWQDWFWRGSWEGKTFQCPWNNAEATCPINLDFTKATSHAREWGISIGPGGNSNDWFKKVVGSLTASFNYSRQKTWTNSFSFRPGGSVRRGQFAEPITVQVRRWTRGYYKGGWVEKRQVFARYQYYCYDFDANRSYGQWSSNTATGASYHTIHIY